MPGSEKNTLSAAERCTREEVIKSATASYLLSHRSVPERMQTNIDAYLNGRINMDEFVSLNLADVQNQVKSSS